MNQDICQKFYNTYLNSIVHLCKNFHQKMLFFLLVMCAIIIKNVFIICRVFLMLLGHILGLEEGLPSMEYEGVGLGTRDHDRVGEQYLRNLFNNTFVPDQTEL